MGLQLQTRRKSSVCVDLHCNLLLPHARLAAASTPIRQSLFLFIINPRHRIPPPSHRELRLFLQRTRFLSPQTIADPTPSGITDIVPPSLTKNEQLRNPLGEIQSRLDKIAAERV